MENETGVLPVSSFFFNFRDLMVSDRILMPAFGPAKIRGMFNSMTDIASQLLAKWEVRHVPCSAVQIPDMLFL